MWRNVTDRAGDRQLFFGDYRKGGAAVRLELAVGSIRTLQQAAELVNVARAIGGQTL
jgi:hypothetical protein